MNAGVWTLIVAVPSSSTVMDLTHVYASVFDHKPTSREILGEFNRIAMEEHAVRSEREARDAGWDWKVQEMDILPRTRSR